MNDREDLVERVQFHAASGKTPRFLDAFGKASEADKALIAGDWLLYGNALLTLDGKRLDPTKAVKIEGPLLPEIRQAGLHGDHNTSAGRANTKCLAD